MCIEQNTWYNIMMNQDQNSISKKMMVPLTVAQIAIQIEMEADLKRKLDSLEKLSQGESDRFARHI